MNQEVELEKTYFDYPVTTMQSITILDYADNSDEVIEYIMAKFTELGKSYDEPVEMAIFYKLEYTGKARDIVFLDVYDMHGEHIKSEQVSGLRDKPPL